MSAILKRSRGCCLVRQQVLLGWEHKAALANQPDYPEEARQKGVQGTVLVSALVGTEGEVLSSQVINESDPALAKAALAVVNQYHFEPMMLDGAPIEVVTTISVRFRLAK